jgi:hypothetical protein
VKRPVVPLPLRRALACLVPVSALLAREALGAEPEEVEIEIEASPAGASGPELVPADSPVPPPSVSGEPQGPPSGAPPDPASGALEASVSALAERIAALEAPPIAPPPPRWWEVLDLRVTGYVQAQVEHHQLSEDELSPDGRPLNQDRFLVRRGRLRVDRSWRYAQAAFELDASTTRGPFLSVRRAEGTLLVPREADEVPYAALTAGLSEIPFGYELAWGNRERPWMERTTGSLAFFRGEPDVGVRGWGGLGPVRYALAVQNGVPLDDRPGAETGVLVARKTVVGRVGLWSSSERHEVGAGVSALDGGGLHAGDPERKGDLTWRDVNQDGIVTLNELVAEPAQAATPSTPFRRWGLNADVEGGLSSRLGWTRVYGEVTLAQNLDRGLFVADPIATGYDLRELAWTVSVLQDVTRYGLVGVRGDVYDPDADAFEQRRGVFETLPSSITTISPLVALQLPNHWRLAFQYDWIADHLGRDSRGVPIDLPNDAWTTRLQAEF